MYGKTLQDPDHEYPKEKKEITRYLWIWYYIEN